MSPVPVRSWAKKLSPETRRQLERLAAQPYVLGFARAEAHLSDGVAVGSVFATEHEVVPRALEHLRERVGPRLLGTRGGGNHFVELDRRLEPLALFEG